MFPCFWVSKDLSTHILQFRPSYLRIHHCLSLCSYSNRAPTVVVFTHCSGKDYATVSQAEIVCVNGETVCAPQAENFGVDWPSLYVQGTDCARRRRFLGGWFIITLQYRGRIVRAAGENFWGWFTIISYGNTIWARRRRKFFGDLQWKSSSKCIPKTQSRRVNFSLNWYLGG